MRFHKNLSPDKEIRPNIFREHGSGISTDWNKYSTPEQTKQRSKVPSDNAVISLNVGEVKRIKNINVEHAPIIGNRAHSEIRGMPKEKGEQLEIRVRLARISKFEIRFEN
jgi:hypothetical protein